jgi:2',3'-cyclic-nucleotide 2'-phosphodiesterase (5'-nucleotidase family)
MKKRNKIVSLFLVAVLAFTLGFNVMAAESKDIVVLYTNDVHCAADDNIGYAGLAAYKADMLKTTDYVTLVDDGDALQGGVLGTLSKGSYMVDIMNTVGYNVAVPGNHEFDYGMENFLSLAKTMNSGYVCCNFMDLRTGLTVFDSYKMITYGDVKVAYVGIDTPEAISKSTPTYFQDAGGNYIYGFCSGNNGQDLYNAVQKAIDAAKTAGATYVVAVGHCGTDEQSAPWRSTDIIANVTGLSAFIDGHSHSAIPGQNVTDKTGKTVVLTSSGTKLAAIGKLVIKADGTVESTLITDYKAKDAAVSTFINDMKAKNQMLLDTVVATTNVALTTKNTDGTRAVRSKETNLGDLAADAFRIVGSADIGWVNGGGVRADIAVGDITYGEIISVFPFNNSLCVVEASGQEIVDALEMAARVCPSENGGFLQVSGLKFTIDTRIPSSVKVDDKKMFVSVDGARRVKDVLVLNSVTGTYEPIVLSKTYTLASHDYMLKSGGDGINMFMDNKLLKDATMLDNQVLISYITSSLKGVVPADYGASQGRITIKYAVTYLFADVIDGAWYEDYVQACYDKGLISGTGGSSYGPDTGMTRAAIVAMLYRLANAPAVTGKVSDVFADCVDTEWYADAVLWASRNGITTGVTPATFAPDERLTRQELAVFIYKYAVYKGASAPADLSLAYSDATAVAGWAKPGVAYCAAAGIIKGMPGASFDPNGTASRAMGAAAVSRIAA